MVHDVALVVYIIGISVQLAPMPSVGHSSSRRLFKFIINTLQLLFNATN